MTPAAASALDIPTLLLLAMVIATLLGIFLLVAWLQDRGMRALAWWGAAYLIGGCAIALWNVPVAVPIPAEVPGALMFVACGMVLNGVRLFHGRAILPFSAYAGAIVWAALTQLPAFTESTGARGALGALVVSAYTFFIALELRNDRRKAQRSVIAMAVVPIAHAVIFLMPVVLNEVLGGPGRGALMHTWFDLFAIETVLYAVGTAFIVLLLVKERHVQQHKSAASTDPLTGLFNRRAFFEAAEELRVRAAAARQPLSVLMFDLDHFKSINDRFGHAVGDDVIRRFAACAATSLRGSDIVARLGGEEFAAVVPGGADVARLIGERVRENFIAAGAESGGLRLDATVSVGAACSPDGSDAIAALIERADEALYEAKKAGRNRVCIAAQRRPHPLVRHIAAARAAGLPRVKAPALAASAEPEGTLV